MNQELWTAVDEYIVDQLLTQDDALNAALRASDEAGLPPYNVSPNEGKLLSMLARIHGVKRILEIGTLGGYSTIWLARALPADGKLITLEFDPKHAGVASQNIARAGLADVVEVMTGPALTSLSQIAADNQEPFDLTFIDADKQNNPGYFEWALQLSRPGSVIIVDNVVRDGKVIDADSNDPSVIGTRQLNEMLAAEPRVTATAIQTVGCKGYDGFAIAIVES